MAESTYRLRKDSASNNVALDVGPEGNVYLTVTGLDGKCVAVHLSTGDAIAVGAGIQAAVTNWAKQSIREAKRIERKVEDAR